MTKLAVMRGSWLSSSLALVLAAGCGMGMDETDPENPDEAVADESGPGGIGDVEQDVTAVTSLNFENYGAGALASPWSVGGSLTSHATIETTSEHGTVVVLQGSPASGDLLVARLPVSVSSDVIASVDVNPDSGAAFVWSVDGKAVSSYKRRIRLQRSPDSTRLIASASPSGNSDCGSLPSGTWTTLTMVVHTAQTPSTFDILINGNATACTGLRAYVTKPFDMVEIMDSSSDGWGGKVRFDNILLGTP
jgi:hypothetical protein